MRPPGRVHRPASVLRQRAETPPPEGRRASATVPGRIPEARRVRGRRPGRDVHAGHYLSAGQGVRQDVHVHHHAGHGTREVESVAREQRQGSDDRHQSRRTRSRSSRPGTAMMRRQYYFNRVANLIIIVKQPAFEKNKY